MNIGEVARRSGVSRSTVSYALSGKRAVSEATLRRHVITLAHPEVLVPPGLLLSSGGIRPSADVVQMSSPAKKI